MSVYRRFNCSRKDIKYLKNRINHICDLNKSTEKLWHVRGASKKSIYEDMLFIKRLFMNITGVQYMHWLVLYDDNVDLETADKVGQEILDLIYSEYDRQVVMSTHCNTEHYHNHFIINSVSYKDGKKFRGGIRDLQKFRTKLNKVLDKYDLTKVGKIEEGDEEDGIREWDI